MSQPHKYANISRNQQTNVATYVVTCMLWQYTLPPSASPHILFIYGSKYEKWTGGVYTVNSLENCVVVDVAAETKEYKIP